MYRSLLITSGGYTHIAISSLNTQTTMSNNSDNIETIGVPPAAPVAVEASIPLSIEPCTLSTMEEHITQLGTQLQQLQQSIQSKSAEINHAKRRMNYIRKSQIKNATIANNKDGTTKRKRFRKVCTTGKSAFVLFYHVHMCVQCEVLLIGLIYLSLNCTHLLALATHMY